MINNAKFEVISEPELMLKFTPSFGADFRDSTVTVPHDLSVSNEHKFEDKVKQEVRRACGHSACYAMVDLRTSEVEDSRYYRTIESASLFCDNPECPLEEPGESGDREPRHPLPPAPVLEAEEPLPEKSETAEQQPLPASKQ